MQFVTHVCVTKQLAIPRHFGIQHFGLPHTTSWPPLARVGSGGKHVLQCVTVCCSASRCVAACCSVLQRVAALFMMSCSPLACTACGDSGDTHVVQCVVVCCSVWQCDAACGRVWQCGAAWWECW